MQSDPNGKTVTKLGLHGLDHITTKRKATGRVIFAGLGNPGNGHIGISNRFDFLDIVRIGEVIKHRENVGQLAQQIGRFGFSDPGREVHDICENHGAIIDPVNNRFFAILQARDDW